MRTTFPLSTVDRTPAAADSIASLTGERYRPMLRLLDDSDLEFLALQPGFDPKVAARLHKQRCMIFGCYLSSLGDDFRKSSRALRNLLLQSPQDRPDLASQLVRRQVRFALCALCVRWRLFLYRWGIGRVEVDRLMTLFDSVCADLRNLSSTPAPQGS